MWIRQVIGASAMAAALVVLTGCNRGGDSRDGMSTESNLSDDAAANDVLGGNDAAANPAGPS